MLSSWFYLLLLLCAPNTHIHRDWHKGERLAVLLYTYCCNVVLLMLRLRGSAAASERKNRSS